MDLKGADELEPMDLPPEDRRPWPPYLYAALAVLGASALSAVLFRRQELADIVMTYVLAIVLVAARWGRGPSLLASALSVAAFDFIFIPPYFTFVVSEFRHVTTFGILMASGWIIGTLTERLRQQARLARLREHRTAGLLRLSKDLAKGGTRGDLVDSLLGNLAAQFRTRAVVLLPDAQGCLAPVRPEVPPQGPMYEMDVAQRVYEHREAAGRGTPTLPGAKATYLPLRATGRVVGVLGVLPEGEAHWAEPDQRRLLEAFASQAALALERLDLAEQNAEALHRMDQEQVRNALLSSVSHDLRTPLGSITGAASTLLEQEDLPEATRRDLLQSIQEESQRLHRLVSNLLDITRLESGRVEIHKAWIPLEEVVGSALDRLSALSKGRDIRVDLPDGFPLAPMDPLLMEQVLINLLDNALKYAPPDQPIEVKAWSTDATLALAVTDSGPGIPEGEADRIFEKLVRGSHPGATPGAGLGLAICKAIVEAHGGRIQGSTRPEGGAQFLVTLPLEGTPPPLPPEGEDLP